MSASPVDQRTTPRQMAAFWLNEHRAGDMTREDVAAFDAWLGAEPANRAAYEQLERLWGALGAASDDPRIMRESEEHRRRFATGRYLRFGGLAASLVAAVAAATLLWPAGEMPRPFARGAAEFQTSVGQRTTVTLPDHSVVTLDTDTVLRVHDKPDERLVSLDKGRAFFRVAHDPSRPFIVEAKGHRVRAIGTAFDVRVDARDVEVTLIEGKVKVESRSLFRPVASTAQLTPGQRLEFKGAQPQLANVDLKAETTWHSGRLTFTRDPLAQAVAEMNRYSDKKIVFVDGAPDKAIVGVFRAGDVDSFAQALTMNGIARVVAESDEAIELGSIENFESLSVPFASGGVLPERGARPPPQDQGRHR